jgi:hypothetical protein
MSGGSFADFLAEDRRLAILRLLVEARGEAGESVLEKGLKGLGHRVGVDRDVVRADLRFLVAAECAVTTMFDDRIVVAQITKRGVACAEGNIAVAGVAEPSMGV